ncbi:CVNH domain-containing protein [Caulobacter sp. CCG-8]|uniref:CVNH domain-containing protein n=1 Tax=Caulobacter sp. CCG-8 TaxID=3127958 RepID=UPI00307DC1F2
MSKIFNLAGATAMALAGVGSALVLGAASPAAAASGFQNTCSNIAFGYSAASQATVSAMCLRADGSATGSSLVLTGITNQNGTLKQGSGDSTFQKSCGNIQITANAQGATLSALCRNSGGGSNATSLPLNNIGNNNGRLTY